MGRFEGRVVLVTGSSSGIGAQTAVDFAREGAKVVLTGRREDKLQETLARCMSAGAAPDNIFSIAADVTVEDDVHRIIRSTVDKFQTIHILVNNAGDTAAGSMANLDLNRVDHSYSVNLRSPLMVTKVALPYILENKEKGCIVNVGSMAGDIPMYTCLGYSIMKAAVHHFTKCLALELADKGVRVNAVSPGTIANEFLARPGAMMENQPERLAKFFETMASLHPLKRVGYESEVSKGILFLASDEASFTTGTILEIDGGRHCAVGNHASKPTA